MTKILVLFTGGTIGSFKVKTGTVNGVDQYVIGTRSELEKLGIDTSELTQMLIDNYNKKYNLNKEVLCVPCEMTDILSENMTFTKWNEITNKIRNKSFKGYDGVIITHGTDTLGYFANYLSMILSDIDIPIFLVSSNYILDDARANGNYNFQAACDFIKKYPLPGIYVTFRNTLTNENKTRIIYGSRLMQCNPLTNDFESITNKGNVPLATVDEVGNIDFTDKELYSILDGTNKYNKGINSLINEFGNLKSNVLLVEPYVGINYANYNLKDVDAILHGLYHSGTACTDTNAINNIINFNRMAKNNGSDLYAGPFYGRDVSSLYSTSSEMLKAGVKFVTNTSKENAYVKLCLAYDLAPAFGIKDNQLSDFVEDFMNEQINQEFINPPIKIKKR